MNSAPRYHPFSAVLHWLIAGLIVVQFILANLAEIASEAGLALRELALLANHKSVGITVLTLAIIRLLWRRRTPPPKLPAAMARWQVTTSHVAHWALYGLIFAIPLSGWLMSSATAYSVSWFNLIQLPDFVAPNEQLAENFETIHEFLAKVLFVVALVHVLAALKHHFIDRDAVLERISSKLNSALFLAVIAVGIFVLSPAGTNSEGTGAGAASSGEEQITFDASNLPLWTINYETSFIRFTGNQAGADFDGVWQNWSADIRFDEKALKASSFDVTIYTGDVETQDGDRDSTLAGAEWFDVENHPEAFYRATSFVDNADGSLVADGQLVIKGVASTVPLTFRVETDGSQRVLIASANVLRLDHGVGSGEWEDTSWVSNEVSVAVRVDATITTLSK